MRRRSGFGVLIAIVVLLMACLLVAGMSQLFFSGQVYSQSAGGAGGMAAEYLAESVIEDFMVRLSEDLNDPGKPVFKDVRTALLTRNPPVVRLGKRYPVEHLKDAIKTSPDAAFHGLFDIEQPEAQLRVVPLTDTGEAQMLEVTATVKLKLGRRAIVRRVRVHRQVGITRVAPRRPFDAVTFAILRTSAIRDTRTLCEEIETCVKAYNRTGELLEGWKSTVEGKPLGVAMTATLPPLAVGPERATQALPEGLLADQQYFYRGVWDELEEAPLVRTLPPDESVLFARAKEEVKLEDFQYYRKLKELKPLVEQLRKAREKFPEVMEPMESASAAGQLPTGTHSGWSNRMGELGRDLLKLLKEIQEKLFAIAKHMKAHSQPGVDQSVVEVPRHWDSQIPLWPLAHHVSGEQSLKELLAGWPAVAGHLAIYTAGGDDQDSTRAAFTIDQQRFRGAAILSLPQGAGVAVRSLTPDGDQDRMLVVADHVHLTGGPIKAAIVARKNLFPESGGTIEGTVILEQYKKPDDSDPQQTWQGKVRHDKRYRSGRIGPGNDVSQVVFESYTVGINPRVSFKEIAWE